MEEIIFPKSVEVEEETNTYGRFVIAPLERGYGHTIGNSLRRILLSSIEGAAIVSCNISGVKHELSTIKGVKEDVIYILQNLKKIRFKVYVDEPETLRLHVKGTQKEIVMASDFEKNPNVDILTPEQIIATLSKDGEIEMSVEVRKGRGYVPAEKNKKLEHQIGTLYLDALFSPVYKVNYRVQNMAIGERMDCEKIILEMTTDGSIKPSDALAYAAKLLIDMLHIFLKPSVEAEGELLAELVKKERIKEYLKDHIEVLQLSTRPYNRLKEANINTIGDLVKMSEMQLRELKGFGAESLKEIKEKLKSRGLSLGMEI